MVVESTVFVINDDQQRPCPELGITANSVVDPSDKFLGKESVMRRVVIVGIIAEVLRFDKCELGKLKMSTGCMRLELINDGETSSTLPSPEPGKRSDCGKSWKYMRQERPFAVSRSYSVSWSNSSPLRKSDAFSGIHVVPSDVPV